MCVCVCVCVCSKVFEKYLLNIILFRYLYVCKVIFYFLIYFTFPSERCVTVWNFIYLYFSFLYQIKCPQTTLSSNKMDTSGIKFS